MLPAASDGKACDGFGSHVQRNAVAILCVAITLVMCMALIGCSDGSLHSSGGEEDIEHANDSNAWNEVTWDDLAFNSRRLAEATSDDARYSIARGLGIVDEDGHLTNTVRRIDLTNGYSIDVRIIGICHDVREDGSVVGLTLMTTGAIDRASMNDANTVQGGWEQSALRGRLSGEILNLFPEDVRSIIAPVIKLTNNRGLNDDSSSVTTTVDTLWLPSVHEVCGDVSWEQLEYGDTRFGIDATLNGEGQQYQYFFELGVSSTDANAGLTLDATSGKSSWWLRTPFPQLERNNGEGAYFYCVSDIGNPENYLAPSQTSAVVVCFCI